MKKFEDLKVFQAAVDLMVEIYATTANFPTQEQYGLTSQMRRAAVSVVSNIAEGQGRFTFGEWRQMLSHARGSLFEIEAQMIASNRLKMLSDEAFENLRKNTKQTGRLLAGFIRYVKGCEEAAKQHQR